MGVGLNAAGQIVEFASPTAEQRATRKAIADARKATKNAARDKANKLAKLIIPPTKDPKHAGALWNNNGAPAISAG
jgi:hypothetical protein